MKAQTWVLLSSLLLVGAACGPREPGLQVKVKDVPAGTVALTVRGLLDGGHVLDFDSPKDYSYFGLALPEAVLGRDDFQVQVEAQRADLCVHAAATSDRLTLKRSGNPVLMLELQEQDCSRRRVDTRGEGFGTVTEVAGVLVAKPDASSYFAGWRGTCGPTQESADETGRCAVSNLAPVTALFGLRGCLGSADGMHWCWENPLPQGNDVNGVHGLSHNDVWAVGAAGALLHYDGNAWSARRWGSLMNPQLALKQDLRAIWGTIWGKEKHLFVVGTQGIILHSKDGGLGWEVEQVPSNTNKDLWAVHGTGPQDVWAIGEEGVVLQRGEAGSWRQQKISGASSNALLGVHVTKERIWLTGKACTLGRVERSNPIWTASPCPLPPGQRDQVTLRGVRERSDGTEVFAVGSVNNAAGVVLRWDGERFIDDTPLDVKSSVWSALAEHPTAGILVAGEAGVVLQGEGAWRLEGTRPPAPLQGVWVSEVGGAFAAGQGGVLSKRGPGSWKVQTVQAATPPAALRAFAHSETTPHPLLLGGAPWVVGGVDNRALVLERDAELQRWRERPLQVQGALLPGSPLSGAYAWKTGETGKVTLAGASGFVAEVSGSGEARVTAAIDAAKPSWQGVWRAGTNMCLVGAIDRGQGNRAVSACPGLFEFTDASDLNAVFGAAGSLFAGGSGNGTQGSVYQLMGDGTWLSLASPPGAVRALWVSMSKDIWAAGAKEDFGVSARVSMKSAVDITFKAIYEGPSPSSINGLLGQGSSVYAVGRVQEQTRAQALVVHLQKGASAVEICGSQHAIYAIWGGESDLWIAGEGQSLLHKFK